MPPKPRRGKARAPRASVNVKFVEEDKDGNRFIFTSREPIRLNWRYEPAVQAVDEDDGAEGVAGGAPSGEEDEVEDGEIVEEGELFGGDDDSSDYEPANPLAVPVASSASSVTTRSAAARLAAAAANAQAPAPAANPPVPAAAPAPAPAAPAPAAALPCYPVRPVPRHPIVVCVSFSCI